ncbi:MAG: hypothetical protein DRN27_10085, partial [Thermoplasmata archaeon]
EKVISRPVYYFSPGTELKKIKEKDGNESIVEDMKSLLFAQKVTLRGNALGDEFGITLITKDAKLEDIDVEAESEKISKELEEMQ